MDTTKTTAAAVAVAATVGDGLDDAEGVYLISDRELDRLGEALAAWEASERTARWWERGMLDDPDACDAA